MNSQIRTKEMSGLYGKTYVRRKERMAQASARSQRNRENALARRRMLSATGVSNMRELSDLMTQTGSVPRVRPSLQVAPFLWTNNKAPQQVRSGGGVYLFSSYTFGSADYQRHTNETMTYKMSMMAQFGVDSNYYGTCAKYSVYYWLIYDTAPTGQMPTCASIFDTTYDTLPVTWTVSRDVCHRFVVKKKGRVALATNGLDPSAQVAAASVRTADPCNQRVDVTRFFKRLGVRTEWKNSQDGGIGDIKSGALYLAIAPSNGVTVNVYGRFRLYFKSVGNQ